MKKMQKGSSDRAYHSFDEGARTTPQWLDTSLSIGGWLTLISLIIGPLWAGSYFGHWRMPLLVTGSIASGLLFLCGLTGPKKKWLCLVPILWIALQGVFMSYNSWGKFITNKATPWWIFDRADQPFPNLPGAVDVTWANDSISYILPCLGLIFGVRYLVMRQPKWFALLCKTIFWTGAAVALVGLIQRSTGASSIYWLESLKYEYHVYKHFFGPFRSPGIATCYLNIALAFGLSYTLNSVRSVSKKTRSKNKQSKPSLLHILFPLSGTVLIPIAAINSGSKTGMLLSFLTIIIWGILNWRAITSAIDRSMELFSGNKRMERNVALIALGCIGLLLLLIYAGYAWKRWETAHKLGYSSLENRIAANKVILKIITRDEIKPAKFGPDQEKLEEHFAKVRSKKWGALGLGPGSFYPIFPYHKGELQEKVKGTWFYAHNDYMQTLLEWGWLGGSCFFILVGGGLFLLAREVFFHRKDYGKTRFIYLRGYFIGLLILMLHANIDFPFQIESIAMTVSVILGVAWGTSELRKVGSPKNKRRPHKKKLATTTTS